MALISIRDVTAMVGGSLLLDHINLIIEQGDRISLVGRNGVGKTTLLKIIYGMITPDSGSICRQKDIGISLLPQEIPKLNMGPVSQVVMQGYRENIEWNQKIRGNILKPEDYESSAFVHYSTDGVDFWRVTQRIDRLLSDLRVDPDALFEDLSIGLKRRVLLAIALSSDPDLLLLDEPTNHLDIESILHIEDYLLNTRKALLIVTHDRVFLQHVANRIVEIDRSRLYHWNCDYISYLERKRESLENETREQMLLTKTLSKEEAWLSRGVKARRTRDEGRKKMLEKMRETHRNWRKQIGSVQLQAQEARKSGKLVMEIENIQLSFGDRMIIRDFSMTIIRGDKIGIIGPNGCGKSSLVRVLMGELMPNPGSIRYGTHLDIAYFDQSRNLLQQDKTVLENVSEGSDIIFYNEKPRHIFSYLADFLFTPDRIQSPVWILSGGERNRLLLAKLFARPSNVLILDEPTNDLDTDTLVILEEMLMDYPGTLVLVSHDRALLNNVVTRIIAFEEDGRITEYAGGYDDWCIQKQQKDNGIPEISRSKEAKLRSHQPKLTFKENLELQELPARIEQLEVEQRHFYQIMSEPDFYLQEKSMITRVQIMLQEIEQNLNQLFERWQILEQKQSND